MVMIFIGRHPEHGKSVADEVAGYFLGKFQSLVKIYYYKMYNYNPKEMDWKSIWAKDKPNEHIRSKTIYLRARPASFSLRIISTYGSFFSITLKTMHTSAHCSVDFPGGPVFRTSTFIAMALVSIPDQGTKILPAMLHR